MMPYLDLLVHLLGQQVDLPLGGGRGLERDVGLEESQGTADVSDLVVDFRVLAPEQRHLGLGLGLG